MKKIIFCLLFSQFTLFSVAQVAIGKNTVEGTNTLLDFNNTLTNTSGIILPALETSPLGLPTANNGTFIFDRTLKKVRMFENNSWVDLTDEGDETAIQLNTASDNTAVTTGVIVGSETSDANGVLILESTNKAMILPKINRPHENVKSPYAGMMCYDTESKSLAIFDGTNWSYWK